MSVWRRPRHRSRSDGAVCARFVLDDDRLLERNAERLCNGASDHVGAAASAEWDDNGDRFARIIVIGRLDISVARLGIPCNAQQDQSPGGQSAKHPVLAPISCHDLVRHL